MEPQTPTNPNIPNNPAQPPVPPAPTSSATPEPIPAPESTPKKSKLPLIIGIIVAILVIAGVIVGFIFFPSISKFFGGTTPTPELAEQTCAKYNGKYEAIDISGQEDQYQKIFGAKVTGAYACVVSGENTTNLSFQFATFEENLANRDLIKKTMYSFIAIDDSSYSQAEEYITTLEDSSDFYKAYFQTGSYGFYYGVAYKNTFAMVEATDANTAEDVLISLGYPDRSHADASATNSAATTQLQISQQNTEIRNDLATVATQFVQYEADNKGQLPTLTEDYTYVDNASASSAGEIGTFYTKYLNSEEEFANPLGDQYVLKVYNSPAAAPFASDYNAISGSPANEIYVVYGAECEDSSLIATNRSRNFAILLAFIGDRGVYCSSN